MTLEDLGTHCDRLLEEILGGYVVPFLGAGANLAGRPAGVGWARGQYLPDGAELARYLADRSFFPRTEARERANLQRVSQYFVLKESWGPLYNDLRQVFDADYPPGPVHRLLARLAATSPAPGRDHLLVVTTNYDDALERAYDEIDLEYDTVWYLAEGQDRRRFVHRGPGDSRPQVIKRPNGYTGLSLGRRPVILKMHGGIDRGHGSVDEPEDSYVVTEDHYINYLSHTSLTNLVPVTLLAKLNNCKFLFLGYGLNDWNLRVILNRIQEEQRRKFRSWAVQRNVDEIEAAFWEDRMVDIVDIDLEDYVARLEERMGGNATLTPTGTAG